MSFDQIFKKEILSLPNLGTINCHASKLPFYRGRNILNWVLINDEKETGLTTFFINEKIDEGAIIHQSKFHLDNTITAADLHNKLIPLGYKLLAKTIDSIGQNKYKKIIQNNKLKFSLAPKINKELLKINWSNTAREIYNLIRGLSPLLSDDRILNNVAICPSAWFYLCNQDGSKKRIKIHRAKLHEINSNNLEIKSDNKTYLDIVTYDGILSIINLQAEGKKSMNIKDFLQGNKINSDCYFL